MTDFGKGRRWAAAIVVSLLLHSVLFITFYEEVKKSKTEEPVMNVKLVYAPKQKAAPAPAPQKAQAKEEPKQTAAKTIPQKAEQKPVQKTEVSVRPSETKQTQPAESSASENAAANPQPSESSAIGTAAATQPQSSGGENEITDARTLSVTHKTLPEYPAFSRKRKEEGRVTIIVTIEDGVVKSAETENSSGYERLDAAALRAAKGWKFAATGKMRVRIPFVFKIK